MWGGWGRSKVYVSSMTTSRERSYRRRSPGTPQKLACVGQDGGSWIPRESVPQAVGGKCLGGRNAHAQAHAPRAYNIYTHAHTHIHMQAYTHHTHACTHTTYTQAHMHTSHVDPPPTHIHTPKEGELSLMGKFKFLLLGNKSFKSS